jgi:transcriptional regulator with XRE-family HTH domain
MSTITKIFSENIRRLRKDRGLTQTELADIIGISLASIQGYEAERVWPAMDTVKALAKALKVSESELFRDPDYKPATEEILSQFGRLLAQADPLVISHALQVLSLGKPEAAQPQPRRKAQRS